MERMTLDELKMQNLEIEFGREKEKDAFDIYDTIAMPYNEARKKLANAYDEVYKKVRTLSLLALVEIIEHRYDANFFKDRFDGKLDYPYSFTHMNDEMKGEISNIAKQELVRRTKMVHKNEMYLSHKNVFERTVQQLGYGNIEELYDKFDKSGTDKKGLLSFKIVIAFGYIANYYLKNGEWDDLINKTAYRYSSEIADCLPNHADEVYKAFNKDISSRKSTTFNSIERKINIAILKAVSTDKINYTYEYSRAVPQFGFLSEEIEKLSDDKLDEYVDVAWRLLIIENIREEYTKLFKSAIVSSPKIYFDSRARLHDTVVESICPVCKGKIHPVYAYGRWIWWHDNAEDYFSFGHSSYNVNDELTQDELDKFDLNNDYVIGKKNNDKLHD